MKDTDIQNHTAEEILQALRQEIETAKKEIPHLRIEQNINPNENIQENNFYRFAKKMANFLQRKGLSKIVNFFRKYININKYNHIYILADFSQYHDEHFIDNAYNLLLKRAPSSQEKTHYLEMLRSGALSKTEIIITLHYSKEGKKQNIIILGSKKRYLMTAIYKTPILGYMAKLSYTLLTLPKLLQRINQYENYVATHFINQANENTKLRNLANTLFQAQKHTEKELEKKVDKAQLELPEIPNALEIEAIDFLADAITKFSHPKESFKDFKKEELYYSLFESTFYNHDVVLQKQAPYLNYIPKTNSAASPHLDIGCGRGEFLTLLRESTHHAVGIDINSLEVQTLKKQGFDVHHKDMIDFLQTTPKTFSSISALQVIEHIDYDTLKAFASLAYDKIQKEGILILETINPHNKVAFNSFYMDETHKRPLPPEMVVFLLQYTGFKNVKLLYTSPMPKEFRSRENQHINYHDYAVIGYKI